MTFILGLLFISKHDGLLCLYNKYTLKPCAIRLLLYKITSFLYENCVQEFFV